MRDSRKETEERKVLKQDGGIAMHFQLVMLKEKPFRVLVEEHPELVEMRREYEKESRAARRRAAEWAYAADVAADLTASWAGQAHQSGIGGVHALTIDPWYGPGMLTVGSIEYQLGRVEEAMALFLEMVRLPGRTKDLPELVDRAGMFLTDSDDFANARHLYEEAVRRHPKTALFHSGLGYCHGKSGRKREAVESTRRAVQLEPDNHEYQSDLGWSLIEAQEYEEAESVLNAAIAAAPTEEKSARARANLAYLHSRRGS